ncbi:restriction endonuclease subunit S [Microcoleus sp. Pol12B3]
MSEAKKLPDSWQWASLEEICEIVGGNTLPPVKEADTENRVYCLKVSDLDGNYSDGYAIYGGAVYTSPKIAGNRILTPNAIVFPKRGGAIGTNKKRLLKIPAVLDPNLMGIQPKISKIFPSYLHLWFEKLDLSLLQNGSSVPQINRGDLAPLLIPLPPLAEQKRIAAIAQKADRLRRTRRYALQLSDTYVRSVFLEMFGDPATNPKSWDCATIDNVVALSQYGTSEKSNSEKRGYPVLGMGNITYSGHIDLTSVSYVELSEKEFYELKLVPGDIIFNRTNSTELVGKTAHWNYKIDAVLASYLVKLKLTKEVLPDYFVALLNSKYFKQLFQERCKKAIGQSNISPTLLKEFPMLVPPLPLQEKFAQIVQKFDRLRTQQREADRQAEHLFQTILHRAFRGELTSQNADDEPESVLLEDIRAQQAKAEAKAKTATQAMGDAADYLGTKAKQQDIEPIQLKFPGFE